MPLYPITCTTCPFKGDVLERAANCRKLRCPECGAPAEQDYSQKTVSIGNRQFNAQTQESFTEAFHSTEVGEARRELGKSGECVQPDGSVRFKDRGQQRQYMRDKRAMKQRFQEQNARKRELKKKRGEAA